MRTLRVSIVSFVMAFSVAVHPNAGHAALCASDCNGDGQVFVNELIRAVGVALESTPYRTCPPADTGRDGAVTVDEVLQGVQRGLDGCPAEIATFQAPEQVAPAGPMSGGLGILPSGRRVTPAGTQVATETMPLNMALTADGNTLVVTNDGYSDDHDELFLQAFDTHTLAVSKIDVQQFYGLAMTPGGESIFVGSDQNGTPDRIDKLTLHDGRLSKAETPFLTLPDNTFPSGLALSQDGSHLFALGMRTNSFLSIDLATKTVHQADKQAGNYPYSVLLAKDGKRAFVTSWGINNANPPDFVPAPLPPSDANKTERSALVEIDLTNPDAPVVLRHVPIARSVRVNHRTEHGGSHPSAMALSPDGAFLYITATNVDLLIVLDAATLTRIAEVPLNIFEPGPVDGQLQGLYPNALAVSPDGKRLYVADAGISAVQVINVDATARTFTTAGFIPTGWYPTSLALTNDGKRLYVGNTKAAAAGPNGGPGFNGTYNDSYIGQLLKGSLSVIDNVDQYDLQAGQAQVVVNCGFAPQTQRWVDGVAADGELQRGGPVPADFGAGPSEAIEHVVFIFKENRTYDQIYGTFPGGNGDPSLAEWASGPTPNHQALAREFAMGDNFFNDGEVSILGHQWQDQSNCTDWTEKLWPGNYDRNLPSGITEQGQEGFAKGGYLFDALERQDISFRVYGETLGLLSRFSTGINQGGVGSIALPLTQAFPGRLPTADEIFQIVNGDIESLRAKGVNIDILKNTVWPNQMLDYPANIIPNRLDTERAELFKGELDAYTARGVLPKFLFIWLPNNHTFGATPGEPTPRSAIADNDAGLGMVVDGLTHSPFWPKMAIFVTEDDPQGGVDHVSAHRTLDLVISPYAKRGYVSHRHHSSMSINKTMLLLMGAAPMSQYDRYATDMRDYFTTESDLTPYTARPRNFPPEVNPQPGAAPNVFLRQAGELSEDLDLSTYDLDGNEMSRILALVSMGEKAERASSLASAQVMIAFALLISSAVLYGRRRRTFEVSAP